MSSFSFLKGDLRTKWEGFCLSSLKLISASCFYNKEQMFGVHKEREFQLPLTVGSKKAANPNK